MSIVDAMKTKRLYFDGAMGSMLIEAGLDGIPDLYALSRPDTISRIHEAYLRAGCDIVITDTFGANPVKLPENDVPEIIRAAIGAARQAIGAVGGKRRFVALDIGPTGRLLRPLGDLSFDDTYNAFASVVRAGSDADLILVETMTDLYELKAAVLAAKENSELPVFATVSVDKSGRLLTGADIAAVVALLEGLRVDALGLNCSHAPDELLEFVSQITECSSLPIILNPNAGLPDPGSPHSRQSPESFARAMARLAPAATLLGGCCGTTPAHIEHLITATENIPLPMTTNKNRTVIASGCGALVFEDTPVLIGERLNPTGKKRLKAALREGNMDYLLGEAIAQQSAGADVLDVNVGLPELDEADMMVRAVEAIQGSVKLPLQIDSADPVVLEAALRIYNGKALINSVNGKAASMAAVFPLAAKYGGVIVGLTLDENGIPDTAEGRLDIAKRIVDTAKKYGISKNDIIIDGLTLSVSSDPTQARVTLDTVRLLREKLGVRTSLGVSNVSFGLPRREQITSAFLTLALNEGLSAAIADPCSEAVTGAMRAFCALKGLDPGFITYTSKYGGEKAAAPTTAPAPGDLGSLIRDGISGGAGEAALKLLKSMTPADVIDNVMIPALNEVGARFEAGSIFLPQLMRSAEAAQSAFDALRGHLGDSDGAYKDEIVIATVQGDIHDIGKNIAKALLSNYGYKVTDLGKDVPPETIANAVMTSKARFVGLSALMTTTVRSMERTINVLKSSGFTGKVMVSGAVMTPEYADMIGADAYVKDAMAAISYMESL